jgi:hypothetical protein
MARELRAAALAGTLVLTTMVAACGDGGKPTGVDDGRGSVLALPSRPTGNVVKAPRVGSDVISTMDVSTTDISGSLSPDDLVETIVGAGVTVSNVEYIGADVAAGTFTSDEETVGFESGIILSTGDVANVRGPNEDDGITGVNDTEGDEDLSELAGFDTHDAAVLTFDFVPAGETVTFRYVFASDEYNEFVNSQFNDVFAFYVNGENCAVVGEDDEPVSINTINNGNPDLPDIPGVPNPISNPDLYRNNDLDNDGGDIDTEMDGLTTVLTCTAEVNPGETNTMKLAIADGSDFVLDAVVFIEAGSLQAPNEPPTVDITAPDDNSSFPQGTNITFTGTGSDPEDGALTGESLAWSSSRDGDLGTGTSISTDDLSVGTHTITLTGTDSRGETATATIQVTITGQGNRAPTATIEGPDEGDVGEELSFTTGADDPDGDALTCRINWGDSSPEVEVPCDGTLDHTYTKNGTFIIFFTARDPGGLVAEARHTVTIGEGDDNRPPVPVITGPEEGDVGEELSFTTSATDPDNDAPLTCEIDWGDNTGGAIPCDGTPEHAFTVPGTYTVTLTARDPDGAVGTDTWQVTIESVTPPTCSPGTGQRPSLELVGVFSRIAVRAFAQGIPEGEMLRFSFRDSDCGPWTARIDWGDGQPASEFPISEELGPGLYNTYHLYGEPGDYTVRMTITDAAGLVSAEQSIVATVIDESGTP